jgi:hypothetical protein
MGDDYQDMKLLQITIVAQKSGQLEALYGK